MNEEALKKGRAVHDILEKYPEQSKYQEEHGEVLTKFKTSKYMTYLQMPSKKEMKISLNINLEPEEFKKVSSLFMGYIDYFTVKDNVMTIIDWKTGKLKDEKYQDYYQLMFYGIYMFKKYSKIDTIHLKYIYVEHSADNSLTIERKYLKNYIKELFNQIQKTETSKYEKKVTKLCDWCDFKDVCDKS